MKQCREVGAESVTLKNGTVITFPKAAETPAAQASAAGAPAPPRKGALTGVAVAPEKSAEDRVDPLLSPELRAQLEADRIAQLMIDDPVAYEQHMMDSMLERERQLGSSSAGD